MDTVELQDPGIGVRVGYDAWRKNGSFAFRAIQLKTVFARRAGYFRENRDGRVFRVESRYKTVQVNPRFVQLTELKAS